MMGWKYYDDSVEMLEQRFKYLPQLFRWRGRYFEVDAVERCWTVVRRRRKHRLQRRYFQVQCGDGTFELYQDLETGLWHLRRARMSPARSQAVRYLAPAWR
jgi:hypothetical protein